jgi:hypothetical protein
MSDDARCIGDEIGRYVCSKHKKDRCHICCLDYRDENEIAEIQAGLRKPPSRAQILAKEKVALQRGIKYIMKQPPQQNKHAALLKHIHVPLTTSMEDLLSTRSTLKYHQTELKRVDREIKVFNEQGGEKEFAEALGAQLEKAQTQDAEIQALTAAFARQNPGESKMENFGGPAHQKLYDDFVKEPPSSQRDQAVDPYTCSYCGKSSNKKMACCARCKKQAYCSKECQTQHWKGHKKECKRIDELPKADKKKLPLTWAQLEEFQEADGKTLEVRFLQRDPGLRLVALCNDRVGATKRVFAYTLDSDIPGFREGTVMLWKNPRFHSFMDGSSGARIEQEDLANITILLD